MRITVNPGRDLDEGLVSAWRNVQTVNPALASPYFAPEFTQAVAAARDDVRVAIIETERAAEAFFPFQHEAPGRGGPVGGILSDYQGLICTPGFSIDPTSLIRACGLTAWRFDHLLATQPCFVPYHRYQATSPQIDLTSGHEAYVSERRSEGSKLFKKARNLARRLEREVGALRFVAHSPDKAHLERLLEWKSLQYCLSSNPDLFPPGWIRDVVCHIHRTDNGRFGGVLSLLYAGDRVVAGHFGMRCGSTLHYWFPAYDLAMEKYSPGLLLLLKTIEQCRSLGVSCIDLGASQSLYKERLMNSQVSLASGIVDVNRWRTYVRNLRDRMLRVANRSPIAEPLRKLKYFTLK